MHHNHTRKVQIKYPNFYVVSLYYKNFILCV